jgi:hypothetical protein
MPYLAGGPQFYDHNGNPVQQIQCGTPYTFDVPGYSPGLVWLEQTHNGAPSFSGAFQVPMPSYISDCVSQVGQYMNTVYTLGGAGGVQRGQLIGSVTINILPGQLPQGVIPSDVVKATPTGIVSGIFASIPMWGWVALAVGALVVMQGAPKRNASLI